jgi:phospho-2-dehydro-3-deoxyheptonate aldolase
MAVIEAIEAEKQQFTQTIIPHQLHYQKSIKNKPYINLFVEHYSIPTLPIIEKQEQSSSNNASFGAHIINVDPIMPPACLLFEIPLLDKAAKTVIHGRNTCKDILSIHSLDHRLIVIVGPESIKDITMATHFAHMLSIYAKRFKNEMVLVMRTFFDPDDNDTSSGWAQLCTTSTTQANTIGDGNKVNQGLREARKFLAMVNSQLGLPCATRLVDIFSPLYIGDLISWAIPCSVELASGVPMPVGFETNLDSISDTIQTISSASKPHKYLSPTRSSMLSIASSTGNQFAHPILKIYSSSTSTSSNNNNNNSKFIINQINQVSNQLLSASSPSKMILDISLPKNTDLKDSNSCLKTRLHHVTNIMMKKKI